MSDFKPSAIPADLAKILAVHRTRLEKAGYVADNAPSLAAEVVAWEKVIAANNKQRKKLHQQRCELLDFLKPHKIGNADIAWQKIEGLARAYDRRETAPFRVGGLGQHHVVAQRRDPRLYKRIRAFSQNMKKERDKCAPDDLWLLWHLNNIVEALDKATDDQELPPHKGTKSPVPVALIGDCIVDLAALYKKCTGKKPGAGVGPFANFVATFWSALGNERGDVAIIKDIQKARKARPEAF